MEQHEHRGFFITSEHEGTDGEITGYSVSVDSKAAQEVSGEEQGSAASGSFATVTDAVAFIDAEYDRASMEITPGYTIVALYPGTGQRFADYIEASSPEEAIAQARDENDPGLLIAGVFAGKHEPIDAGIYGSDDD